MSPEAGILLGGAFSPVAFTMDGRSLIILGRQDSTVAV